MSRKRICIIAFKPVYKSIHILRQIDYLTPHYDLTIIGYGESDSSWPPLTWHAVPESTMSSKVAKLFWYVLGRIFPFFYDAWYWSSARHKLAYDYAVSSGADAFHANDWVTLPIAVEAARRTGGRVVFHMHEYAEEERPNNLLWKLLVRPAIRYLMRKYISLATVPIDGFITVCKPIAERYRRELGINSIVVFNAPAPVTLPSQEAITHTRTHIRLIHHGYAKRDRGLHKLISALALTDPRFVLDFMLMEDDPGYIDELKRLAERLAPGRVHFRKPVPPQDIVQTIAKYDLGFCVIEPSSYNNLMMLPDKFFEYIQAGLAVCIGPSPAMTELVMQYGVGVAAPSFAPSDVANTLNQLTLSDLEEKKRAARRAATVLNADVEMGKIVALYDELLGDGAEAVDSDRLHAPGSKGR